MKKALYAVIVLVIIGSVAYAAIRKDESTTSASHESLNPGGGGSYTMTDVAAHSTPSSCWAAIEGNVYDLSAWISQHPGGPEAIESLCGTDATAAFEAQHGGQRAPAEALADAEQVVR